MDKELVYFNDDNLYIVLGKNNLTEIRKFLEPYGIDSVDRDGRTMLMNLIAEKKAELLKEFIKLNPNINHQDFDGYTALHFAVQEKFIPAIDLLLNRDDLKIDLQDNWGNTPLWRAIMNSVDEDIIIKLLERGADINAKNNSDVAPIDLLDEDEMPKVIKWIEENKK